MKSKLNYIVVWLFLSSKTGISITCVNMREIAEYTDVQLISNYCVIFISADGQLAFNVNILHVQWETITRARAWEKPILCCQQDRRQPGLANLSLRAPPNGRVSEGHCLDVFSLSQYSPLCPYTPYMGDLFSWPV